MDRADRRSEVNTPTRHAEAQRIVSGKSACVVCRERAQCAPMSDWETLLATPQQPRLGGCTGKGFMPGQSGNPAGSRTSHARATARALAKALSCEGLWCMQDIMCN